MDFIREKTVCFTGHRPEKLPGGGNASSPQVKVIKSMLYAEIVKAADEGCDTFITGMQRGIDLWAGEAVMSLAASRNLKLAAVLPYKGMGDNFKGADKWLYGRIIDCADEIIIIAEKYTPSCMAQRNRFMVDNSARIIAVVGEMKSGTGQTVNYAVKQGLKIHEINLLSLFPEDSGQLSLF